MLPGMIPMTGAGNRDPFFANVSLLLHGDGADGSTIFTDSSSFARSMLVGGNAQIDTAQAKFGGASMLFDGADDYIRNNGTTTEFLFGTADFTIEMWFRLNALFAERVMYDGRAASTNTITPFLEVTSGNRLGYSDGITYPKIAGTTNLTTGVWYHAAVTRTGGITRLFLNGALEGSVADTTNYSIGANRPLIGASGWDSGALYEFNGWIDDLRVTKGVARYTSAFSPPTQAFPSS